MNADNLHYTKSNTALKNEWENKRNYYIDKVIETAAENGVILKAPVHDEEIPAKSEADTSSDDSGGITDGSVDDLRPGPDAAK